MTKSKLFKGALLGSALSLLSLAAMAADLPVSGGITNYPIGGPKSKSPEAITHYNNALAMIKKDPSMLGIFNSQCNAGKAKAAYLDAVRKSEEPNPPQPVKMFDDMYFFPVPSVAAFAVSTPDGIILVDTLNNEKEGKTIIEAGMKKLGLDPAKVKDIIVTHEHGDHYGSAKYFQDTYHARVYASAKAWDVMDKIKDAKVMPPKRDQIVTDGMKLTLGGKTLTMYLTPGHTVGTVSVLIPVKDHGTPHLVYDWGGTAVHNELLPTYINSLERFRDIALKAGADAAISEHYHVMSRPLGGYSDPAGGKNPLVFGTDGLKRFTDTHLECLNWAEARVKNGDPD